MLSPMTVLLPAVVVAVAVALPMAVVMVVAVEPPLRCGTIRAMVALARPPLPLCVQRRPPQWWRKWLLNRWLKRQPLPRSQRCLQAAPVVVVQRPADRAKTPLILLISPIGSTESVGLLVSGWS